MKVKELLMGDPAPELRLGTILKGQAIDGVSVGTVYVIECWATWCGPCLETIPHLTKLQKTFPKVRVVGVAINDPDEDKVAAFVAEQGETMVYTVAMDGGDGSGEGWVARHWFRASFQSGIPTAYIVDAEGRVAWIGHPGGMEEVLSLIVEGRWNLAEQADSHRSFIDENKVRESFALEDILKLKAETDDKRGMIEALDEAFAAHPELEKNWANSKLEILLQIDHDEALIYAGLLSRSVTADGRHDDLSIGRLLISAAVDDATNTVSRGTRALYDQGLECLIAYENRLRGTTSHPGFINVVNTTIIEALLVGGDRIKAKDRATAALAFARETKLSESDIQSLHGLLGRCEDAKAAEKKPSHTVICDGDVCTIVHA